MLLDCLRWAFKEKNKWDQKEMKNNFTSSSLTDSWPGCPGRWATRCTKTDAQCWKWFKIGCLRQEPGRTYPSLHFSKHCQVWFRLFYTYLFRCIVSREVFLFYLHHLCNSVHFIFLHWEKTQFSSGTPFMALHTNLCLWYPFNVNTNGDIKRVKNNNFIIKLT